MVTNSEKSSTMTATVLQVLPALGASGGVERGTVEIAGAIVAAGGRAIVASSGGRLTYDLKRVGAEHFELPTDSKNPFVVYANISRLAKIIEDQGVDIVHARSRAPAWSAYFAAKRQKCHFATTFHGTYSHRNPIKRHYNSVMVNGEKVIAISGFIAGHIRQVYGVSSEKIHIVPRCVDLTRFDPAIVSAERVVKLATQWRLTDGEPVVMLPGRLTRWKGQGLFIEAISRLDRENIRCLLIGSDQGRTGYLDELENLVNRHRLGGTIRIVGHCDDMPAAYMLADVVVSASTDPEAFGRVVAEAQAMGRPVIAPDHGGARETIIDGDTGWLIEPDNVDALAKAINHGLELKMLARRILSAKAITNVRDNFSKSRMCDATINVYQEMLETEVGG